MPRMPNIYLEAQYQGRLWTPLGSPEIVFWADGRDPTTMTLEAGGKISSWRDKFGRELTQTVDANRPLLQLDSGGFPNGAGGVATGALSTANVIVSTSYTFILLMTDKASGQKIPFYNGNSASSGWGNLLNYNSSNAYHGLHGGVAFLNTGAPRQINSVICFTQWRDGAANVNPIEISNVRYNPSASSPNTPSGTLSIAAAEPILHGAIVSNRAMTDYERNRAEAFLWWHHGFGDQIPKVNPFCNRPPLIGD